MDKMTMDAGAARRFIETHTIPVHPPLVPEVTLYTATEITPIWEASEAELAAAEVPPPFWAFPWAGGQALARYILDNPELVAGRHVLDFGSGSGLVGIAALKAGARSVEAAEIDPIACTVIGLNAGMNGVELTATPRDVIGEPLAKMANGQGCSVVLVGDMCYERPLAEALTSWLRHEAAQGAAVLMGDAGRNYLPGRGLARLAQFAVPTTLELEDKTVRDATIWRLLP
ncbi:MAG TPA: 50S ribosomal protein L11 methyltransferase [Stellaceae bacterium]|nr:50S ribosomal protein L11 methyltransferase [Stellaceae bacterium]